MDSKGLSLDGAGVKIYFFTKGSRQLASSRVRAHLIADHLRKLGFDAHSYHVVTRPWWNISIARFSEFWRNLRLVMSLGKGDILYIQRAVYQIDFMVIVLIRRWLFGGSYVYDFDDAIFLEKYNVARKNRLMISYASLVVVGNNFLRDYALNYNKNIFVIPTLLDTEQIERIPRVSERGIIIGWTGSSVHYDNLKIIIEPLQRIVDEGYKIEFMQVGGGQRINELLRSVKGLQVTFVTSLAWDDPKDSAKYVGQFDIGIAPLEKTEWNLGKDMWKTKEYMACGAAVVVTNWGEGTRSFRDGVNGLLANTPEDWYRILKRLITDEAYCKKIANGGRSYVERNHSYRVFIPKLLNRLEAVRVADLKETRQC